MPKNTKVHKTYEAVKEKLEKDGMSEKVAAEHAARIAQAQTHKSLATGKTPKKKKK